MEKLILSYHHKYLIDTTKLLLTGLHACGDLSTTLFREFVNDKAVTCLLSVSCCYMKLTENGYPMSAFVAGVDGHELNYKTREISCHALENYHKKLKGTVVVITKVSIFCVFIIFCL